MASVELGRQELLSLLDQVDSELADLTERQHDVMIAGGAAVALLWDERRLTNDVDVVSDGTTPHLREAAERVADRWGLDDGWFNDAAKVALPVFALDNPEPVLVFDGQQLQVYCASARTVLAMKLFAARETDFPDILVLMREAKVQSREELYALVESGYGAGLLLPATEYAIERAWEIFSQ